jgi:3-hydroxybutyrate dehydrogenase
VQADVTDEASGQAMFAAAGPCDIVIANAGRGGFSADG